MLKSFCIGKDKEIALSLKFWLGDRPYDGNIINYWDPYQNFITTFTIYLPS